MINPVLTVISLIAGGLLFSVQHQSLDKLRTSNGLLETQRAEAGRRLNHLKASQVELAVQLKRESEEVQKLLARKKIEPMEFEEVEQRGTWPDNKEYFYLAKNLLPAMGYSPFNPNMEPHYGLHLRESVQLKIPTGWNPIPLRDRDARLTDEPVLFYGMNQEERDFIDAAYQDAWQRFIQITCGRIERLENNIDNPPPSSAFYRIPANENDEIEPIEEYRAAVRNVLGEERADYFLASAIPYLRDSLRLTRSRTAYVLWGKGVYWMGKEDWGYTVTEPGSNGGPYLEVPLSEDYYFSECFR